VGLEPKPSDADLVTLAVIQALLGFVSEADGCATPTRPPA
jgi:2C-methyl-D-erythritol 2,4-cyclodiphosphate synthase